MPSHEGCRLPLNHRAPPGRTGWPTLNGDDPPPSLQLHYRAFITTTRQSAPVRRIGTFGLAVLAACAFSLAIAGQVLTFRTKAWLSFAPPTCRMPSGQPSGQLPNLSREKCQSPVLASSKLLSTLQQWFACARLSQPCLPGSSSRRFRNAHHHRSLRQQLAVAWDRSLTTEPEGPSFISRTVTHRRLDRRYS